jgi:hypothetical protein
MKVVSGCRRSGHVADALEGLPAAQQMDGQRVTQDMGAPPGRHDAGLAGLAAQPGVHLAPQRAMRRPAREKDLLVRRRRTIGQQVVHDGLARRPGQRQPATPAGLGRDDGDLVVHPVDVAQPQRPGLTPAQAVTGDEQEHGVAAPAARRVPAGHGEQPLHLLPGQGTRHAGKAVAPPQWHRADQMPGRVTLQVQPAAEPGQRRGQVVPRGAPQPRSAAATEHEQVLRGQRRQLGGAHCAAAAGQEVAKVAPVVDNRRLSQPPVTAQEPAITFDQSLIGRLVRHNRRERAFLAEHCAQVRQASPDLLLPPARRAPAAAARRKVTAEEVLDDRVIKDPFDTSRFLTQDTAEMNHGVSVVPAGSLRIPALAQPQDQPGGLWPQRRVLPPHVEQPVPECFVHLHLQGS